MRREQRAEAFVLAHAAQHELHLADRAQKLVFPRFGAAAGHIVYCVVARDNHQRGKQRLSIAARPDAGQYSLKQRLPGDRTDKHIRRPHRFEAVIERGIGGIRKMLRPMSHQYKRRIVRRRKLRDQRLCHSVIIGRAV